MPNPFKKYGSVCTDGTDPGDGCQTDNACHSVEYSKCVEAFKLPTGESVKGCSECVTDSDCPQDGTCEPVYRFPDFAGFMRCSYGEYYGGGCKDATPCPDLGVCTEQPIIGDLKVKVCSQCSTNADCIAMGEGSEVCAPGGGWNPGDEDIHYDYCGF